MPIDPIAAAESWALASWPSGWDTVNRQCAAEGYLAGYARALTEVAAWLRRTGERLHDEAIAKDNDTLKIIALGYLDHADAIESGVWKEGS